MSVMKKIKPGNGEVSDGVGETLRKGSRNLPEERGSHEKTRDESIPDRGHSECKGSEVGRHLWCLRPERRPAWLQLQGQDRSGPSRVSLAVARNFDGVVSDYRSCWRV